MPFLTIRLIFEICYFMACFIDVYYVTIVYMNHFGPLINIKILTFYAGSI